MLTTTKTIGILIYPGCLRSGAIVPMDVFAIANRLSQLRANAPQVKLQAQWISARPGSHVQVDGLDFPTQPVDPDALDALMLPGVDHQELTELTHKLDQLTPELAMISAFSRTGKPLISSCSSTCLVARTGMLDGKRATTSWWLSAYFRKQFPKVLLDVEKLVVQDGNNISSGGVTSYLDLALCLVGHFAGEPLRQMTSKILILDSHRASQAPYIAEAMIQSDGHALIERARHWINQRLDQPWTMSELAEYCNTSPRTLLRRFQVVLGVNPTLYTQQLRVERAKALLETTHLSLDAITSRCGYEDVSTFSRVFKRWAQLTPREYRSRFGLRQF